MQYGDKNTKFFYAVAKTRTARNRIMAIEDENGTIKRGDGEIGKVAEPILITSFRVPEMRNHIICQCLRDLRHVLLKKSTMI